MQNVTERIASLAPEKRAFLERMLQRKRGEVSAPKPLVKRNPEEPIPLSFAQQRLWFLDQLEPNSATYNISAAAVLRGTLDVAALERTLNTIVSRHESLRTTIGINFAGMPEQIVHAPQPLQLPVTDLTSVAAEKRRQEAQCLAHEEARTPFDLAVGPLLRTGLLKLAEDEYVLLWTMHHIISDGWSMNVLVREVAALYGAYVEGKESPLAELPLQFGDYAAWQRDWLQGEVLENQLAYWRRQLDGAPEILELPIDKPRPAVQTFQGTSHEIRFSTSLTKALRELSQREETTLYMVLLAAFQTLLYRYSGQNDICVGSPIANRNRVETEGVIGFFLNTLVLRTDLSGNPTFLELLQRVRDVALGAFSHQDLPFEKLVEELQVARDTGRQPLFQVMFAMQTEQPSSFTLPGLRFEAIDSESLTAKFDLNLFLTESPQGLVGVFEYNTDLFETATIARMATHFERILQAVVQTPQTRLLDLPLLSEAEERRVIEGLNAHSHVASESVTVHEQFARQATKTPDAVALVFDERELTYRELDQQSNQLARYLRKRGVSTDTVVAIKFDRSAEMFVAMLSVLKSGAAYLPLDPGYPAERLAFMYEDAQPRLLLTSRNYGSENGDVVFIDDPAIAECSTEPLNDICPTDVLAYVIYTSGSTGRPKGVCVTHRLLKNLMSWHRETTLGGVNTLGFASLSFDMSFYEAFAAWTSGGALVVADEETRHDAAGLARLIGSRKIVKAMLPVLMLQQLAECEADKRAELSCLREVITAGEQLRITRAVRGLFEGELRECELQNHYGPAETHVVTALPLSREVGEWAAHPSIGKPLAGARLYVLDQELRPVPEGVRGEIYIGGEALGRGYWKRASLTAERFIPNPYGNGERLYRTGDVGRWLANGELEYVGRVDQQVKIRGFRIEPGEIEAVLRNEPRVSEAVVVTRDTTSGEKRLVGYIVPEAGATVTVTELRAHLRRELPEYMVPGVLVLLESLPLTPSGKLDRRALPDVDGQSAGGTEYEAARTPVEEVLCGIWAEVLRVDRVGINDDFFALGGHSLLATQAMSRIKRAFNIDLPLRTMFEASTVAALAERVALELLVSEGLESRSPIKRVSREGNLAVSFAQQRLWFIDQLEPGGSAYNLPTGVRLRGQLDVDALEATFNEIVRRHESLRTTFTVRDGQPVQVIGPAMPVELPLIDLSEWPEAEREQETARLVQAEAQRPFDLATGPMLRTTLLRLSPQEHIVLLTMHHIVGDGWSMGVLVNEVAALYRAFLAGEESPLAELSIQYADYAAWQREWLQGEVLERQLNYWKEQLTGTPALLELPADYARPAVQSFRGASESFTLSAELTSGLLQLSRREGVTLYMTLLAAFQTLLHRYSGQEEICVGSPIANRTSVETEALIGFFINNLVLRGRFTNQLTFQELLQQSREVTLGAYAHQDLPFERLVEELQPERSLSHTPLFQVTFSMQNAYVGNLALPNLTLSEVNEITDTVKYDLSLLIMEAEGCLHGTIVYNRDLFAAPRMQRMVNHFSTLLREVVADVTCPVSRFQLLSEAEQQQLLVTRNSSGAEAFVDQNIAELFAQQAELTPENIAVVCGDERLSYAELDHRSNQLARHLQSLGVGPEMLVGVLLERSTELVVSLLAILKAGGGYLPLESGYPLERLSFMLADAGASVILTQERLSEELPATWAQVVCVDTEWESIAENSGAALAALPTTPDAVAYISYTSGSTGKPKGVCATHRGVVRLAHRPAFITITPADRFLLLAPVSFDASTLELWGALLNGACLVVAPAETPSLPELGALLQCERISVLWLTAGLFQVMVEERVAELAGVREMLAGGDVVPARAVRQFLAAAPQSRFSDGYGPTENTTFTCCHAIEAVDEIEVTIPIGQPIRGTQVYVLDDEMQLVPEGVVGELYTGGAGLTRGYLNRTGLTAERFVPHPYSTEPGARLYRTGDMVRWNRAGKMEFVGRVDEQVKVRGFRIELGEVETALRSHGKISEAVVVVQTDESGTKRLVGYVVAGETLTTSELREYMLERLPEYMVPSGFVQLEELPLNANGKVDRRALPEYERGVSEANQYQAPRTQVEEVLCGIWAEVLKVERVGVNDDLFELGGHSLLATQIISRVRETFRVEVPLRSLFEAPCVAGLAMHIERASQEEQRPAIVPVSRDQELSLSFAQQRLWFIDQIEPGNPFYNIPIVVRLSGHLDIEALEDTLSEIVRRHESLRTTFAMSEGQPVQVIAEPAPVKLPLIDLSEWPETARDQETARLIEAEGQRPFDLATGPMLRTTLLRLSPQEYVVLLTMHHIVSDGWSMGVLVNEVATLYRAFRAGEDSPLAELSIQYADYAAWQRKWLQGEVLERQLNYWKGQLAGTPALLELPTDYARPAAQSFRGASEPITLSPELTNGLLQLSRREGVTLYMTLLAAFQTLLHRYSGQDDICVGSPIANRTSVETEALIGFFINMLAMRGRLDANMTFAQLLQQAREVTLGAYAHQDLPFERLVEELQPERNFSHAPIFQVMLVLQNAPGGELELPGLRLTAMESSKGTAKFDLNLALVETEIGLAGELEYNTDLFAPETITQMVKHFERLLRLVVADAHQKLSELPLLDYTEERKLLVEFNRTKPAKYDWNLCVHELFERQVDHTPDAIAVEFEQERVSYSELNSRANQLARKLQQLGVGPEVLVGVLMERSVEMVVSLLAVIKAGGAYLPLDPEYPAERLEFMFRDAGPRVLLTQERFLAAARLAAGEAPVIAVDGEELAAFDASNLATPVGPEHLVYVIYTSGSTGKPKAAMNEHRAVTNRLLWMAQEYNLTANDVVLQKTPFTFDVSGWEFWLPLLTGARLVVARPGGHREPQYLAELIQNSGVTITHFVPAMLSAFLDHEGSAECRSLRLLVSSGEALSQEQQARVFERLSWVSFENLYGPTEAAIDVTSWSCVASEAVESGWVSIGRPITNVTIYVLDKNLRPVPLGVRGELYIGGVAVGRGYLKRAGLTAERFVPDNFSPEPGGRLYRTGDLVRQGRDGAIEYLGRLDHQIKLRGHRIELGEIEAALLAHESIDGAVVLVRPDARGENRLVAYLKTTASVNQAQLREHLRQLLPEYMLPSVFVMLEEFPLNASGKVNRRALPEPEATHVEREYQAPQTPLEERLCEIWSEVLRVERVGTNENFFDLGGHSLLATQVISRVQAEFGVEVSMRDFFTSPTVAALAVSVVRAQGEASGGEDELERMLAELESMTV